MGRGDLHKIVTCHSQQHYCTTYMASPLRNSMHIDSASVASSSDIASLTPKPPYTPHLTSPFFPLSLFLSLPSSLSQVLVKDGPFEEHNEQKKMSACPDSLDLHSHFMYTLFSRCLCQHSTSRSPPPSHKIDGITSTVLKTTTLMPSSGLFFQTKRPQTPYLPSHPHVEPTWPALIQRYR